jgi:hypothetical protein
MTDRRLLFYRKRGRAKHVRTCARNMVPARRFDDRTWTYARLRRAGRRTAPISIQEKYLNRKVEIFFLVAGAGLEPATLWL